MLGCGVGAGIDVYGGGRRRCAASSTISRTGRGGSGRDGRDRVGRRHPEHHLPLAGALGRRRAGGAVEPVLLEDGAEPGREPAGQRARCSTRRPTTSTGCPLRLRAHRAARPGVRAPRAPTSTPSRRSAGCRTCSSCAPPTSTGCSTSSSCPSAAPRRGRSATAMADATSTRPALGELAPGSAACPDLDTLVSHDRRRPRRAVRLRALDAAAPRRGRHAASSRSPATATTREGVGSEVAVGEGLIGMAAARGRADAGREPAPDARRTRARVRRSFEGPASSAPGHEIPHARTARRRRAGSPCPPWRSASSSACWWSRAPTPVAFTAADEAALTVRGVARGERDRGRPSRGARPRSACRAGAARPRRRARRRRRPRPTCGSSRSTAARSSTATTSSRASPAASCGRCSATTSARAGRVHQPRGAPRPDARPAAEFRDNFESRLHPAEAPARRARGADPDREDRPRPLPARRQYEFAARRAAVDRRR